jgi:lathosterol oxidase
LTLVSESPTLATMTLLGYLAMAQTGGLGMYFGIGGWFEWFYYRRRKDRAAEWKCQPRRFAPPRVQRRDILVGAANMVAGSSISGVLAYFIATRNPTRVYFADAGHSIAFGVAMTLIYFMATDVALYWAHRILHRPTLFKHIHRWHHRNTTPTAFTSASMHPVEFFTYQSMVLLPLFFMPVPVWGLIFVLVYQNFVALLDHSGVKLRSHLPWQPPPRFHDDHHVFFHVNYGQTLGMWDRMFGTWRREGRVYGEHVFGGRGAPVSATAAEGKPRYIDYSGDGSAAPADTAREVAR